MTPEVKLPLHEQVLLLALHDEKGTLHSAMVSFALAGAMMAELIARGVLRIEQHKKHRVLALNDHAAVDDPLLDDCMRLVEQAKRPQALSLWVARFAGIKDLKHRVAQRLVEAGILHESEDRVLWVFPRKVYPTAEPGPESQLVRALRQAIEADDDVDAGLGVVLAVTYHSGILAYVFEKGLLDARRQRIEEVSRQHEVAVATADAIQSAQDAAAMIAVGAATSIVASSG
jgi:golgi phosphoprotein 3